MILLRFFSRARRTLPAIGCAVLIFIGSTDFLAAGHTAGLLPHHPHAHFSLRKAAHCLEFAVLYTLILYALNAAPCSQFLLWTRHNHAFLITLLYAASDELHQAFVPTRSGRIQDVLIDALGIATAYAFFAGMAKLARNRKSTPCIEICRGRGKTRRVLTSTDDDCDYEPREEEC
eukprot:Protomagalhaensia_sp_Gyna_25__2039@NODE_2098_length_1294_cov_63_320319_g1735_i0_p1_GENE_NODE_2098_length_1294_cov_63_320319_g1735_i0NODE_2098_length_1294_cov_63_320319_g1735_i0_p1_ORF_typecomplete_len175_score5_88VanZ/PF04892_12/1_1e17_NODE_2098_length_1294_cov_63_320319_g1735_i07241248